MLMEAYRGSKARFCLYGDLLRAKQDIQSVYDSLSYKASWCCVWITLHEHMMSRNCKQQANLRGYVATQIEDKRFSLGIVSREHGTRYGRTNSQTHASCLASDVEFKVIPAFYPDCKVEYICSRVACETKPQAMPEINP